MPVLNSAVAPKNILATRGVSTRAIMDSDVESDRATVALQPAYSHGPKHQASAREINLVAHAERVVADGGRRVNAFRALKSKYTRV